MRADSTWFEYSSGELFLEGNILMEEEFWHEAERVWAYASKTRPKNRVIKFKRAVCLANIGEDWPAAKAALEDVVQGGLTLRYDPFNPNQKLPPIDTWLWLASAEHRLMEFEAAKAHVNDFLAKAGEKHGSMEWASKILAEIRFAEKQLSSPTDSEVRPMDINSDANETHPVLTVDGKTLFFSSNRPRSNGSNHGRVDPNTKEHYYDIYQSTLSSDSIWSEPNYLNVGLRNHATVVGSDAFGEKLIVRDDDGWTHELKTTKKWERGWTVAEPMVLDKTIPNKGEVVFFPSRDRLIASIKSRRGEGGFDLFESAMSEDGRWGKLKSLGTRVNTWGDEITPFVAADGQTVFFSSNGLQSMGGFDIYRTTRNAAGGWTEPEHLGSPINSVDDDMAFAIGAKGEVGCFATRRDVNRGDLELFEVFMEGNDILEEEVVVLSLNAEGTEVDAQPDVLVVKDVESGEVVQRIEKGKTEDVFNFILPTGRDFVVESEDARQSATDSTNVMDAESTEDRSPAVRRVLSLSDELGAEVIDVTFEEVFNQEEMSDGTGAEDANDESVAFVVKPQPVVPKDESGTKEAATDDAESTALNVNPDVSGGETEASATPVSNAQEDEGVESAQREKDSSDVAAADGRDVEVTSPVEDKSDVNTTAMTEMSDMKGASISAPIAPIALADLGAGQMVLAVQLYSGQVHSGRLDLTPAVSRVVEASQQGVAHITLEGSASDGPSTRADGNMGLASSRAMDVYIRLMMALDKEGLVKDKDFTISVVRRVQPDGQTPEAFINGNVHPASFQYVRVDVAVR